MREVSYLEKIKDALSNLPDPGEIPRIILQAGAITRVVSKDPSSPIFIQCAGIDTEKAVRSYVCLQQGAMFRNLSGWHT